MKAELIVEGIVNSIQKRIAEYEEISNDLAHDYIQSDKPFPTEIKERYDNVGTLAEGLQEAVNIIKQGDYMREDIDLSGEYKPNMACMATGEVSDDNYSLLGGKLILSREGLEILIEEIEK